MTLNSDAELSSGLSYEEIENAIKNPLEETAKVLIDFEGTDMFEELIKTHPEKASIIKNVLDHHLQETWPENDENESEPLTDFNITDFLN